MVPVTLQEALLSAWIQLNATLKDSRMTHGMTYNEAVVMNFVYKCYMERDNRASVQELLQVTKLLKSQMNRTIDSLCEREYLTKEKVGRCLYVSINVDRLPDFLAVHEQSLAMVQAIIDVIGEADATEFVRICGKLTGADWNADAPQTKGELSK